MTIHQHLEDIVLEKWELEDEMRFLVGLDGVKEALRLFDAHSRIQSRRQHTNVVTDLTWDLTTALVGPPGVGKRSVAKVMAALLHRRRLTNRKHILDVSVADLVSVYEGESGLKTQKKINECRGAVLYVRDTHMMAECGPAASESIDVILSAMNKGSVVCFFAGEPRGMGLLLQQYPGLARRIPFTLDFPALAPRLLGDVFAISMARENWRLDGEDTAVETVVTQIIVRHFPDHICLQHNAHLALALFEHSRASWQARDGELGLLIREDMNASVEQLKSILSNS